MNTINSPLHKGGPSQVDSLSFQNTVLEHGYAVVRSEQTTIEEFMAFSEQIGERFFIQGKEDGQYLCIGGNSGRHVIGDYAGLYIETGRDHTHAVPLHGELYFHHSTPPQALWGYCHTTGHSESGELLLCDAVELFKALPSSIQEFLQAHQMTYIRQNPEAVWKKIYQVNHFEELAEHFSAQGVECELLEDQSVRTAFTCSPLRSYAGELAFINNICPFVSRQIAGESKARLLLDNGELFPEDIFLQIWEIAQKMTFGWEWQRGDIILVDNTRMMHGRHQIKIPGREVFVRFSHASFLDEVAPR